MAGDLGMSFNILLNDISQNLSKENLESLRFLCKDEIGKRKLENIDSGIKLFQQLEELNLLSSEDTNVLSKLLEQIRRPDLLNKLLAFQRENGGDLQQPVCEMGAGSERLNIAFEVICNEVGKDWRMLARKLGHKEALLQQIEYKHPRNMREQILQALIEWQKTKGKEATVEALITTLRGCKLNMVADSVEEVYKNG
ncbi:FAS-associated death domain protein [Cetorhinus maximus]